MLQRLPAYAGPLLGIAAGATAAVFGSAMAGNPWRAAALPAAVILLVLLALDPMRLMLAILALRSAGDVLFDATRFSVAGYRIGVGGVVNASVILTVLLLVAGKPDRLPRRALTAWGGLLLAALCGVALAPAKGDAIRSFLSLFTYFAIFVSAFYVVRSREDFRSCVRLILWSSVIPVAFSLYEIASGGYQAHGFRLQATFAHANIFAFYLTLVVFLTLYLVKSGAERRSAAARAGLNGYMLLLLGLLLLTQTRSAWVACFVIFAVYGLLFERRYLVYLAAATVLALLLPAVQDRILDLRAGNEQVQFAKLNSFAWRQLIWESGLRWMQPDHYLLGYGLDSFRHHSMSFFPLADRVGSGHGAHNIYVQLLFELGVVGLAAFLWLFGRVLAWIRPLYTSDRLAAVIAISLALAYLITSLSDNMFAYLSFNWYFWFFAGAAAALASVASNETAAAAPAPRKGAGMRRPFVGAAS